MIYFGGGVSAANAGEQLRALCAKADIPAAHTLMAAGVLGCDEPRNLGLLGLHGRQSANRTLCECDLLLIAGARCSDRVTSAIAPNATLIQIDVDAAELNKNLSVDIAIESDIAVFFEQLLPLLKEKSRPAWWAQIKSWQARDPQPADSMPYQIMRAISELAGEEAIYVTDVGQHQLWAARYLRHVRPRSFLTSGGLGAMGYGYGAAIGAGMAAPGRPVVHITGDGSLLMNLNEACTALRCQVPVITVILNNRALGLIRQLQGELYDRRYAGSELDCQPDFVKLAEGFGLSGFRCHDMEQFRDAFAHALSLNAPCWIECVIDRDETA